MRGIDRSMAAAAFVIWAACFTVMGIGQATTTKDNALLIHLAAAPVIAATVSAIYFTRAGTGRVLFVAAFFTGFAMIVDFFVVALLMLRSFEMFTSAIGTWIPFSLIFVVTYGTGRAVERRGRTTAREATA